MKKVFAAFLVFIFSISLQAQKKLTVYANKAGAEISPTMWGIFFEDINFAADGGLYAELVKNRSFEFPMPLMGWKEMKNGGNGKLLIINEADRNPQNPRYANIKINTPDNFGISNEGFRGMGFKAGQYNFSVLAKGDNGAIQMTVELVSSSGKKLGTASLSNFTKEWKEYHLSITSGDTSSKGHLNVLFTGNGSINIDMVSLFPQDTWKSRPKGLRQDLVQWLADMKPGFIRFPGGCIVEGRDLANRYQWKQTVGEVASRKTLMNRWNIEFRHRPTPDYYQSFGLGFFEYFQLSEDVGAEPLPILNCGMACQYNSSEVASLTDVDSYIQDALDLIEFANGSMATKWGKLRTEMGHPQPFHLKYMGIGNEQWDEQYVERFTAFEKVLKQQHPEIKLVAAAGPSAEGPRFDYAWKEFRKLNVDLIDEHYYQAPEWFLKNTQRYDSYDRTGPKVFAGEYAAQSNGIANAENRNNWNCALAEAAFMTGLERNADVVRMSSYAPLFAHVEAWQWTPDLIWFDNLRSYGTPNYYVQKLFSTNRGNTSLPVLENGAAINGKDSLYASAVLDKVKKEVVLKIVNASSSATSVTINLQDAKSSKKEVTMEVLSGDKSGVNSLEAPLAITPVIQKISGIDKPLSLRPLSLNVIKISVQ